MFRSVMLMGAVLMVAAGCNGRSSTQVGAVAEEIEVRPIVAVVPVIDSSKNTIDWSLSEELTDMLFRRLAKRDQFFLTSQEKVSSQLKKVSGKGEAFSLDLAWVKKAFPGSEFVVFVELFEHQEKYRAEEKASVTPVNLKASSADLNLSVRMRAVDIRSEPRIVLQEIHHETHHLPRQFTRENFHQVSWKNPNFAISPLGMAHEDLVKTVASRLEEYLLRAKGA